MIFGDDAAPSTDPIERLRKNLVALHAESLRVHDSPVRADRVYAELEKVATRMKGMDPENDERIARAATSVASAMRTLRRDEDGRDAANHLRTAIRQFEARERKPSPFLDDD